MNNYKVSFADGDWTDVEARDAKDAASVFMRKYVDRLAPLECNGDYVRVCDPNGVQTGWEIEIELQVIIHANPSELPPYTALSNSIVDALGDEGWIDE